jgi:hypothetical protein
MSVGFEINYLFSYMTKSHKVSVCSYTHGLFGVFHRLTTNIETVGFFMHVLDTSFGCFYGSVNRVLKNVHSQPTINERVGLVMDTVDREFTFK